MRQFYTANSGKTTRAFTEINSEAFMFVLCDTMNQTDIKLPLYKWLFIGMNNYQQVWKLENGSVKNYLLNVIS